MPNVLRIATNGVLLDSTFNTSMTNKQACDLVFSMEVFIGVRQFKRAAGLSEMWHLGGNREPAVSKKTCATPLTLNPNALT